MAPKIKEAISFFLVLTFIACMQYRIALEQYYTGNVVILMYPLPARIQTGSSQADFLKAIRMKEGSNRWQEMIYPDSVLLKPAGYDGNLQH